MDSYSSEEPSSRRKRSYNQSYSSEEISQREGPSPRNPSYSSREKTPEIPNPLPGTPAGSSDYNPAQQSSGSSELSSSSPQTLKRSSNSPIENNIPQGQVKGPVAVTEEEELLEYGFDPCQEPRTQGLPSATYSKIPIGTVTMKMSKVVFTTMGIPYNGLRIACNRDMKEIGSLRARFARRSQPNPPQSLTNIHLAHWTNIFYGPGQINMKVLDGGSKAWKTELEEGDIFFIEVIEVEEIWEGLGIGTEMVGMAEEYAENNGFRWMITQPDSFAHGERRERETENGKLDMAVDYWRRHGFRRIGASDIFGYSLIDKEHPSRKIAADEDFDPPGTPPISPGKQARLRPISSDETQSQ